MHIPDGYLGPVTWIALFAAMLPVWYFSSRRVEESLRRRHAPMLALSAAFTFVIQMLNVPVPGGTTGHAVGAALVAIIFGPYAATIVVSTVLIIQALLFGDGGITAIGANSFNMAFLMSFSGYYIYSLLSFGSEVSSRRRYIAAGAAGYSAANLAALAAALELGLQPLLHSEGGKAVYFPYPLTVSIPAMLSTHLLFVGFIEGIITAGVVAYLQKSCAEMLRMGEK